MRNVLKEARINLMIIALQLERVEDDRAQVPPEPTVIALENIVRDLRRAL